MTPIADALATILERIETAQAKRGPGPEVRLIGVSKRHPIEAIEAAYAAGLRDVGENYAQELATKREQVRHDELRWHFIGSLQRNKVKKVLGCALIHTLDRTSLLNEIDKRAQARDQVQPVLIEVNAGEAQKGGVAPEAARELLGAALEREHVEVRGLMVMPPFGDPDVARRVFERTRTLRDRLAGEFPGATLSELSMGMSADFEAAIAEGATLVRVGTAIFGARPDAPTSP
jgi:pyridoxal phosphate enzyme (YggS family)